MRAWAAAGHSCYCFSNAVISRFYSHGDAMEIVCVFARNRLRIGCRLWIHTFYLLRVRCFIADKIQHTLTFMIPFEMG